MNSGLFGFPRLPGGRVRATRLEARDGTIGTPIARTRAFLGELYDAALTHEMAAIPTLSGMRSIVYCPLVDRVFAASYDHGYLIAINPATQQVDGRACVGTQPIRMVYAATLGLVVILLASGTVVWLDPRRMRVRGTIASGVASPTGMAWCPTDERLYVVGSASGGAQISLRTGAVAALAVTAGAQDAAYSPVDNRIYLACTGGMAQLTLSSLVSSLTNATPSALHNVVAARGGTRMIGTSNSAHVMIAVRPFVNTADDYSAVGANFGPVAYSPVCDRVYVVEAGNGVRLYGLTFEMNVNSALPVMPSCGAPRAMVHCPTNGFTYAVSDAAAAAVSVLL